MGRRWGGGGGGGPLRKGGGGAVGLRFGGIGGRGGRSLSGGGWEGRGGGSARLLPDLIGGEGDLLYLLFLSITSGDKPPRGRYSSGGEGEPSTISPGEGVRGGGVRRDLEMPDGGGD